MRGVWFVVALAACQADVVRDQPIVDPATPHPVVVPPPPAPIVKTPIEMLATTEFSDVHQAKRQLLRDRTGSLAPLIAMVDRDERVVLENTGDLIYPGAKKNYGHGWIVNYDLDALADRAGWVLEELTFHDFGFTDGVYGGIPAIPKPEHLVRIRATVHAWSAAHAASWNCFAALVEAMRGPDAHFAYIWLFEPSSSCDGFTAARFRTDLLPLLKAHARDPKHPMHDYAVDFLKDLDAKLEKLMMVSVAALIRANAMSSGTLTVAELEVSLGKPLRDIGSGIHIFVYNVDGDELRIGSPDGTKVMDIRRVHDGNETILYGPP
jgi:hypothetical protein